MSVNGISNILAAQFIFELPDDLPRPTILVDENGLAVLSWDIGDNILRITFHPDHMSYVWATDIGAQGPQGRGELVWLTNTIPFEILDRIRQMAKTNAET